MLMMRPSASTGRIAEGRKVTTRCSGNSILNQVDGCSGSVCGRVVGHNYRIG